MEENTTLQKFNKEIIPLADIIGKNLESMIESSDKAVQALHGIKQVSNETEKEETKGVLSRVKLTYDKIHVQRVEITKPLDNLKKLLMDFEKPLSPIATDSEYAKVKNMVNKYNDELLKVANKQKAEAENKNLRQQALNKLKADIKLALENGIANLLTESEIAIDHYFDEITLDNFDEQVKKLNYTPKLSEKKYLEWFKTDYDPDLIAEGEITSVIEKFKNEYPFDAMNVDYSTKAIKILVFWKEKLPRLKTRLEEGKKIDNTESKERIKKMEEEAKEKALKIEEEKKKEDLKSEFEQQARTQTIENPEGARINKKAYLAMNKGDETLQKTFAELIFHCMLHPKFPGCYARGKSQEIKLDNNERQVMIPGMQWWLDFYAKFASERKIDNIEIIESTTAVV